MYGLNIDITITIKNIVTENKECLFIELISIRFYNFYYKVYC